MKRFRKVSKQKRPPIGGLSICFMLSFRLAYRLVAQAKSAAVVVEVL